MDCREYQEQISAAVDNLLSPEEKARFAEHGATCARCRTEYHVEMATKALVCSCAKRVRTPGVVMQRITEQLEREDSKRQSPILGLWKGVTTSPLFKPAVGFALACIAVVLMVTVPNNGTRRANSAGLNDVIRQSMFNFAAVERGEIKPQVVSNRSEQVREFFTGKTTFPVLVPKMKGCDLVGGVLNEHSGTALAHVVYTHNASIIYVYQACWETVQAGHVLNLPQNAVDELRRTGWYTKSDLDGSTIVLWTRGNTLCAAVSRVPKDDLMACLTSATDSPKW